MAEAYKTYDFDEYIRHGEPSQYLYETARRHIEGELTIDEVKAELRNYYSKKVSRTDEEKGEEESYEMIQSTNTEPVTRLVQILGKQELRAEDLSYRLGLGTRIMLLNEYHITPAIQTGFVRMLYPESPRHPHQKYLLTVKGLSFYNENITHDGQ